MKKTTWLHLSDLHFKSGKASEQFNRKIVLDKLWDDIKRVIDSKKLSLDFIAFTGDVAYHGKAEEYELSVEHFFEPLLKITGLPKDRLFIIPGNHDVDWSKMESFEIDGMRGLLKDQDKVNQFLSDGGLGREAAFRKFQGFEKFFNNFYEGKLKFNHENFFFTKVLDFGDKKIGILGLNSAWMSGVVADKAGEVFDKGNLLIGEWQIAKAIENVTETDLRIVLLHHPIAYLHDMDSVSARRLLSDCDILLHGHLHQNSQSRITPLSGDLTTFASGAIYQVRSFPNSYHFAEITYGTQLIGNVIFRKYYPESDEWNKDIVTTGEKNDGEFNFSNPNISFKSHYKISNDDKIKAPLGNIRNNPVTSTANNSIRPLRVFLCHTQGDKPIVRELYQKLRAEPWIEPWLDEEEIYPGQDWSMEIEKAIENTDAIIVCISNNSITKDGYVQREIRTALQYADYKPEGTLFIIPVRLEECIPPRSLQIWQHADYFENQRDRALQRILGSLRKRAESLKLQ